MSTIVEPSPAFSGLDPPLGVPTASDGPPLDSTSPDRRDETTPEPDDAAAVSITSASSVDLFEDPPVISKSMSSKSLVVEPVSRARSASIASSSSNGAGLTDKRVKDWNRHFNLEEDEMLLDSHGAALVINIMIHGRLYISNRSVGFRSDILGAKTWRHFPLTAVESVEPRMVAMVIPNAIEIQADGTKYLFTTIGDRDDVLEILLNAWKECSPERHAEFLARNTGPSSASTPDAVEAGPSTPTAVDTSSVDFDTAPAPSADVEKDLPRVREATQADCEVLEKEAFDAVIPSTPELVYRLLYHNEAFLRSLWEKERFTNIEVGAWEDSKRAFSFDKPLGGSIGSTRCFAEEKILHEDADTFYAVDGETSTPNVPTGKSFSILTRTALTWAGSERGGGTLVSVTYTVQWKSHSFLKGMINGQCASGQKDWNKKLLDGALAWIEDHPEDFKSEASEEGALARPAGVAPPAVASASPSSRPAPKKISSSSIHSSSSRDPTPASTLMDAQTWLAADPVRTALVIALLLVLSYQTLSLLRSASSSSVGPSTAKGVVQISLKRLAELEGIEREVSCVAKCRGV